MKDLEKQIEEAANNFATRNGHFIINPHNEAGIRATIKGFINGAKSLVAKEYWQQGMYSEEEVYKLIYQAETIGFGNARRYDEEGFQAEQIDIREWFNENKKK